MFVSRLTEELLLLLESAANCARPADEMLTTSAKLAAWAAVPARLSCVAAID
ncbi:hypothetical protein DLM_1604 [Aquitalea magnusonii]|uniref:Uncharacterized protein n=1 Tax=Aquitalea magnusonii TaxID=332411 RepID=A0A3G9GEI6_9NEIS|nr:hypothetical protein DLM_1604 [Aquitalea magnusonii]